MKNSVLLIPAIGFGLGACIRARVRQLKPFQANEPDVPQGIYLWIRDRDIEQIPLRSRHTEQCPSNGGWPWEVSLLLDLS